MGLLYILLFIFGLLPLVFADHHAGDVLLVKLLGAEEEDSSSSSVPSSYLHEDDLNSAFSISYQSAEQMLALMKADFGQYLQRLPLFYQKYDGPISQAARLALYWNKIDDLHAYYQESSVGQLVRISLMFPPPASLYSHYAVHISSDSCEKLDLAEWVKVGGSASSLVNSLTPMPLGIIYQSKCNSESDLKKIPPVSKKILREYEKKLAIFSNCYSVLSDRNDFSLVPTSFFQFNELDAPFLSGFKFSNLIQYSTTHSIAEFLKSENEFVRAWLPRDFWRFTIASDRDRSEFQIVYDWVQRHYNDLEESFFANGFRTDTLIQARRTCFLFHRALSSYYWEIDRYPRYPDKYTRKFLDLIEKVVIQEIFTKFGTLPSVEEIELSPELAFKLIGKLNNSEVHFYNLLIGGDHVANLRRADLPPLEQAIGRIGVESLVKIPAWPYWLEELGLSLGSFYWKSMADDWLSSLSEAELNPLWDGGSWGITRFMKSIFRPDWKLSQRRHLFSFITKESFAKMDPAKQVDLLMHPDAGDHLPDEVIGTITPERFKVLFHYAASKKCLDRFKEASMYRFGPLVHELEEAEAKFALIK